jgi:hypothetical protein
MQMPVEFLVVFLVERREVFLAASLVVWQVQIWVCPLQCPRPDCLDEN